MKRSTNDGNANDYFDGLERALVRDDRCQPTLVIDRTRLDRNLDTLAATLPAGMGLRIVAKSLPCVELLRYAAERLGTTRLMTFNLPMLATLSNELPEADHLLGKPFPVAAAAQFIGVASVGQIDRVQWLIDTNERLEQYEALARDHATTLRVSLELDVGLHRGGFAPDAQLRAALHRIDTCEFLELSGFMGYDAHVTKFPAMGGLRAKALASSMKTYERCLDMAREFFGTEVDSMVNNSGGSVSFPLHADGSVANELSIGTTLLKATDFDLGLLDDFVPAVFIATPVLKVLPRTELPGIEILGRIAARARTTPHDTLFIHGGHWLADPVHPSGLSTNSIYGRSSNQEMLNVTGVHDIAPDDFVFLRPHQTEAVLLQFGDIAVYEGGEIIDNWPVLSPSA